VLVGVADGDDSADAEWMARKIAHLRVMPDAEGRMNRSVVECGGALLLVSQFTLLGDARKGRRPSFDRAALPAVAVPLLETVRLHLLSEGIPVETGRFGAHMEVGLVNDGPVTLVLDSAERSR
jgi:D-tyrosyl-tRNA(Tyr) deacylase